LGQAATTATPAALEEEGQLKHEAWHESKTWNGSAKHLREERVANHQD